MKLFIIAFVAVIVFTSQVNAFETVAMFKKSQALCLKEFPISHDELQEVNSDHQYNFKNPSQTLQCYLHCLNTHAEFFDKDGKYDEVLFEKYMRKNHNITDEQLVAVHNKCKPLLDQGEKCAASYNFIACLHTIG